MKNTVVGNKQRRLIAIEAGMFGESTPAHVKKNVTAPANAARVVTRICETQPGEAVNFY